MKKTNQKGFMLMETLIVSTFVLGVLTFVFVQFSSLKRSYDDDLRYDTVPGLYGARSINTYFNNKNSYNEMISKLNSNHYLEVTCGIVTTTNATCYALFEELGVQKIIFVEDKSFKQNISNDFPIFDNNNDLYYFIKKIKFSDEDNMYHLIIFYDNGTYANIGISN